MQLHNVVIGGFRALAVDPAGLGSRSFQGFVFAWHFLYASTKNSHNQSPPAWIRSGVESDGKCAILYVFPLFDSVCVVHDRPDFPRVRETPVKRSGECAQL